VFVSIVWTPTSLFLTCRSHPPCAHIPSTSPTHTYPHIPTLPPHTVMQSQRMHSSPTTSPTPAHTPLPIYTHPTPHCPHTLCAQDKRRADAQSLASQQSDALAAQIEAEKLKLKRSSNRSPAPAVDDALDEDEDDDHDEGMCWMCLCVRRRCVCSRMCVCRTA
jgi:hypothetical protein